MPRSARVAGRRVAAERLSRGRRLTAPSLSSARHALESALLELEALSLGVPTWQVLARALGRVAPAVTLEAAALVDRQELSAALDLGRRALRARVPHAEAQDRPRAGRAHPLASARAPRRRSRESACASTRTGRSLSTKRSLSPERSATLPSSSSKSRAKNSARPSSSSAARPRTSPSKIPLSTPGPLPGLGAGAQAHVARARSLPRALHLRASPRARGLSLLRRATRHGDGARLALALGPGRPADGLGGHAVLSAWHEPVPERLRGPSIEPWHEPGSGFAPEHEG